MPVNTGLANVSNDLLLTAVVIYALAMLAYACDFAFGKKKVPAVRTARVPALVGAASAPDEAALVGRQPAASAGGARPAAAPRCGQQRGRSVRRLATGRARWVRPATRRPRLRV